MPGVPGGQGSGNKVWEMLNREISESGFSLFCADALLLLLSIIGLVVLERYCRALHEESTHCPDELPAFIHECAILAGPIVFLLRLLFFARFALSGTGTERPVLAAGLAAISNPKSSERSSPPRTFAAGPFLVSGNATSAWAINSFSSTPWSLKRSSGCWSKRAPMPYRTAATCLHISAQSGQLHESLISCGDGNRPVFRRQIRSMTTLDRRPCRSSINESIAPAQSLQMDRQRAFVTGATFTVTS